MSKKFTSLLQAAHDTGLRNTVDLLVLFTIKKQQESQSCSMMSVARETGLRTSTVSRVIGTLLNVGLVEQRAVQGDRRQREIRIVRPVYNAIFNSGGI